MCGLVGVFSKLQNGFSNNARDAFYTLLSIDTLRGEDSTGAFLVHLNGDLTMAKEASTGPEFLRSSAYSDLHRLAFQEGAAMIGHNRKATKGSIKDENAHPFVVDDKIVLVHNGGMWGNHKQHADVEVDSHAIAHLLAEHATPEEALGRFSGAYALMWYDVENEIVNIIRNKERPLFFMETEDAWVWSSERAMLLFTAARVGLKVRGEITMLEEDHLNQYSLVDRKWVTAHRKLEIKRIFDTTPTIDDQSRYFGDGTDGDDAIWTAWQQAAARQASLENEESCAFVPDAKASNDDSERRRSTRMNRAFASTVGGTDYQRTSDWELRMAQTCNKSVTFGEFNNNIVPEYPLGSKVVCTAFEYVEDHQGGFYLYATPDGDPEVTVRHHFNAGTKITEERVMQMALGEWKMEFQITTKSWDPFQDIADPGAKQEGYCIIVSGIAKVLEGGGISERKGVNQHAY